MEERPSPLAKGSNKNRSDDWYDPEKTVQQVHYRYSDTSPSNINRNQRNHTDNQSKNQGSNLQKPWAMDYQQHHPSVMSDRRDGGGSMEIPRRYGNTVHDGRRDFDGPRNPPMGNSRMTPHRHHTSGASSDGSGIPSESGSAAPSEDQYETIKEEVNPELFDSDNPERKMTLSPDIQYWFDQKKKIDQLLLPLPEKGQKSPQARLVSNLARIPAKVTGNTGNQQQPAPSMSSGERDLSERHFTKRIFDDGGKISAKDLKEAFATFQNKHFSDGVCKFVVRLFDLDRNGGLDIKEFEQLYSYIKLWVSAYHVYDRHHAGYLTEKDFHSALKHMDIHFSPEFISFLVTRCDPINRRVSLSQFIVTCVQIQKYTDEFKNRDDNYSGTINLRYEDFLEMVLRCL